MPATPTGRARVPRLQLTPAAHRQTAGAHNIAPDARGPPDHALQFARRLAKKSSHYAPSPALPPPSPCSPNRAAQTAATPAAALLPARAAHKPHPPALRETPATTAPAQSHHPASTSANKRVWVTTSTRLHTPIAEKVSIASRTLRASSRSSMDMVPTTEPRRRVLTTMPSFSSARKTSQIAPLLTPHRSATSTVMSLVPGPLSPVKIELLSASAICSSK